MGAVIGTRCCRTGDKEGRNGTVPQRRARRRDGYPEIRKKEKGSGMQSCCALRKKHQHQFAVAAFEKLKNEKKPSHPWETKKKKALGFVPSCSNKIVMLSLGCLLVQLVKVHPKRDKAENICLQS